HLTITEFFRHRGGTERSSTYLFPLPFSLLLADDTVTHSSFHSSGKNPDSAAVRLTCRLKKFVSGRQAVKPTSNP
ncbi:hypothetical protein GWI33_009431, partial [Rhynchophorus ferrugineus]